MAWYSMRWCKLCQSPTPGSRLLQKSPRQVLPKHLSSHFPPPKKTLQPILAFRIHLFSTTTSPVFSYDYLAFFPSLLHALHRSTQQPPPKKKKPDPPGRGIRQVENTYVQILLYKLLSFLTDKWHAVPKASIFTGLSVTREMCF